MWRLLFTGLLVAHGLIHASYLAPAPAAAGGPPWQLHLDRSWLPTRLRVPAAAMGPAGRALVPRSGCRSAPHGGRRRRPSPVQLTVWFYWWLPAGVAIDVALIVALVWGSLPDWRAVSR